MTLLANKPISFSFHEEHDVRIQIIDGNPWFCLKDVCEVLSIANSRDLMAKQLDKEGVDKIYTLTDGGRQQLFFVNEPNLYRVIFRSNKPEAKQFQDWVFNDVLPEIRKTGKYQIPAMNSREPLSNEDMTNLRWLISCMTNRFKYKESWNQGIWFSLRRATGVPSPHPFSVDDLPVLASECRRILDVTSNTSSLICQFEKDVLKHVVRNRKDYDTIANKMQIEFDKVKDHRGIQALEKFEEIGLMRLEKRIHH